jgi:hypothetical protein
MPPLPTITNVFRVALTWTESGGQHAVNVMHIRDDSGGHGAGQLMTALDAHITANQWLTVVNTAVVTDVAITPLDGSSATQHFNPATPAHWTGGNPPDFSPASAAVIKLTTALRGRSHRGRLFLPFVSENIMSNGVLNSTTAANVSTAWVAFDTAMTSNAPPWSLGVASYKLSQFNQSTDPVCEIILATQRRRQGRLRGE